MLKASLNRRGEAEADLRAATRNWVQTSNPKGTQPIPGTKSTLPFSDATDELPTRVAREDVRESPRAIDDQVSGSSTTEFSSDGGIAVGVNAASIGSG